jgi:single-stranded-DNA-specific exonuclease
MGGHAGAAGFLLKQEKLTTLHQKLTDYFQKTDREKIPQYFAGFIAHDWIDFSLTEFLSQLAPFGRGNQEPVFGLSQVCITERTLMGKNRNHLRITGTTDGKKIDFSAFFRGDWIDRFQVNTHYDLLCKVQENIWQGQNASSFPS